MNTFNTAFRSKRYPCDKCGSSDGVAYYEDHTYCHACRDYTPITADNRNISDNTVYQKKEINIEQMFNVENLKYLAIPERGITEDTSKFYGIGIELSADTGQPYAHHYPVYSNDLDNPEEIGSVVRTLPKQFSTWAPIAKAGLQGQHLFPRGSSKYITVTEGYLDAAAAFQMLGSRYPVVSIVNGANNAVKDFKNNLEYLESFERVYICFDADRPGQEAAIACAHVLSPGKARIVKLDPTLKDACGYNNPKNNQREAFTRAWWNAPVYTPAGILSGNDVAERIKNREHKHSIPYPFDGLNRLTYGIRTSEAVVVKAPTGVGKTSFMREIERSILENDPDAKIGTLFLEETVEDSGLGLMSVFASIPFHLPDAKYSDTDFEAAERILRDDRVYFYDSFGSCRIDEIIARVRYYAKGLGCKYIILDHLSIIVSDQMQGDERKLLDSIMTQLKTLTMELDIALIAVVHENRQGQIRGTAAIEQLANVVIALDRDVMAEDERERRTLKVMVEKNRFSGRTGPACLCLYGDDTGRTVEIKDQQYVPSKEELAEVFGELE